MDYRLDGWDSIPSRASILSSGYRRALSLRVKQPGQKADHSPPSGAKLKDGGAIPPLPHMSSWHSAQLNTGAYD
jgi:hypothetical protein